MTTTPIPVVRRFASALLLGAATGAVFLGVGGRMVMHAFALATSGSGGFTVRGSLNVVFAGAVAGAIGGILLPIIDRLLPQRLWVRRMLFAAVCYLIATPGFRPPRLLVFGLFAPAFLAYGVVLAWWWERGTRSGGLTSG